MKKIIILSCILFLFKDSNSQSTFQKVYGDLIGGSAVGAEGFMTMDGGFYMYASSNFNSAGSADYYTMRVDSTGNVLWTKIYGGPQYDPVYAGTQSLDGSFLVAGTSVSFGSVAWIVNADSNGNLKWSRTFSSGSVDYIGAAAPASDMGFILAGSAEYPSVGNKQCWIFKIDSAGDLQWSTAVGGTLKDEAYGIMQTSDGGYLATGTSNYSPAIKPNGLLVKLDATGSLVWAYNYGDTLTQRLFHTIQTFDGGFISVGDSYYLASDSTDALVIKMNSSGNPEWTALVGTGANELATSVAQTSDSGYVITGGLFNSGFQFSDVMLFKLDKTGNLLWSKVYGSTGSDNGAYVSETHDGGLAIVGSTTGFSIGDKGYIIKTNAQGESGCNETSLNMTETFITIPFTPVIATVDTGCILNAVVPVINSGGSENTLCSTALMNEPEPTQLQIYPNPSAGEINIELPYVLSDGVIEMYSVAGEKVFEMAFDYKSMVQIPTLILSNGFYLVKVISASGVYVAKVIVGK
jgi:hypothetical protein